MQELDDDLCVAINPASSHFCAIGAAQATTCPGDVGSGLYTVGEEGENSVLVGIASIVNGSCSTTTGYTHIGIYSTWLEFIANIVIPATA